MRRKKLNELTREDLEENPIWEYWMADNIEMVRPSDKTEIIEGSNTTYLVATNFILKNHTQYLGYSTPQLEGGLEDIQPVVFIGNESIEFYKDNDWTVNEKTEFLAKLKLLHEEVFPVIYTSKIKIHRMLFSRTILDFNEQENSISE